MELHCESQVLVACLALARLRHLLGRVQSSQEVLLKCSLAVLHVDVVPPRFARKPAMGDDLHDVHTLAQGTAWGTT